MAAIEADRLRVLEQIKEQKLKYSTANHEHCDEIKRHQEEAKRLGAAAQKVSQQKPASRLIKDFSLIREQLEELQSYTADILVPPSHRLLQRGNQTLV